jgi:hypothetical protein
MFVVIGAGLAFAIGLRGSADSARLAALAVCVAGVVGFLPSLIRISGGMQTWGLLIFGASMMRMLALLAIAFYFMQVKAIVKQPYWLGVVSGGVTVLVLETIAAFVLLSRFEAERVKRAASGVDAVVS